MRNRSLASAALLFAALSGVAQETTTAQPQATQDQPQQTAPAPMIVLPAGTSIPLVLQRGVSTKNSRPGDMVYLLTTAPVISGDIVAIPPNTFVQGQIARITIRGVDRHGELQIHSANIVFPNGYTVRIPYDFVVPLDRAWIFPEAPGSGKALGLAAALAAPVAGALIGGLTSMHKPPPLVPPVPGQPLTLPNLGNPVKGAAIGAAVGFGVTIPVVAVLLRHHRDFYVDGGLPAEMILERPLALEEDRIATAIHQEGTLAVNPLPRPLSTTPIADLPGASGAIVPGTPSVPSTPAAGEASGTPELPDAPDVIVPGSPGAAYPDL
ncbi:MAG TPA: hypothetical protein VI488_11405 [Candidatus Angelobacter sp.]